MQAASAPILLIVALLAACGGGGGSGGTSPAPPPPAPTPAPPPPAPTAFTISGTVTASSNMRVDGDTNNPQSPLVPNNSVADAQPLPNPVTLGGHVNQPGSGEQGHTQEGGDTDDYFRVELLAGQSITLLVADFHQADADLYLLNTAGDIIDFSVADGEIENLSVTADGTYIVNVFAFEGATNYTLAIGTTPHGLTSGSTDIVPWQAIIRYLDGTSAELPQQALEDTATRMGLSQHAGAAKRTRLMAMERAALSRAQRQNRLGTAHSKKAKLTGSRQQARWETLMTIKALRRDPAVQFAEPNFRVHPLAVPNDEAYPTQWHYPLINLPAAWDMTTGTADVIVAVVDTGILSGHPDLAGQLVAGYDFIRDPTTAGDGNGIDPNPEDPGDADALGNSSFHGSHVSGTIAAASNNGTGVAGVAWNARIMPLRSLGIGGGTSYDVSQAVRYAAGLENDSGTLPAQRADIINLSLGGGGYSQLEQDLFSEVRRAGVIVVAAAGNDASAVPSYPASYEGVISVSAVDIQRRQAPYSNFGRAIDIAAPGGDNGGDINGDGYPDGILSTGGSSTGFVYSFLAGTSMATPHVAGVLALMKSVNAALTPADIDFLLEDGELTDDLGPTGRDDIFGHGIINAERAVTAALTASGRPPVANPRIGASTSLLNFSSAANTLELTLQNRGSGNLQLLQLLPSENWLSVVATNIDASGLGLYRVQVERAGLAPGVYGANLTVISSVNTVAVSVLMSVVAEGAGGDAGRVYFLLVDPDSGDVVAQTEAASDGGQYSFLFRDISPGNYELHAGSDSDNDLFICDAGEACGSYLTIAQPVRLELSGDLQEVDFPIDFQVSIPTINASSSTVSTPVKVRRKR